jgi:alcohol dehydrogenase class IV
MGSKISVMSEAMSLKKNDFDYFYKSICDLLDQFKIPKKLSDIGVKDSSIESLAKKALKDSAFATNPKTASFEEMIELIETSINYGR